MDPVKNAENEAEINGDSTSCSVACGSDLCGVLLVLYDDAQSQSSEVPLEERALLSAVLSSLLALSHSAKHAALQGEDGINKVINKRS